MNLYNYKYASLHLYLDIFPFEGHLAFALVIKLGVKRGYIVQLNETNPMFTV